MLLKNRIEISRKVNIILCDNYKWEALGGLNVEIGKEPKIFGQTGGNG